MKLHLFTALLEQLVRWPEYWYTAASTRPELPLLGYVARPENESRQYGSKFMRQRLTRCPAFSTTDIVRKPSRATSLTNLRFSIGLQREIINRSFLDTGEDKAHFKSAISPNTTCVGTSLQKVERNCCAMTIAYSSLYVA